LVADLEGTVEVLFHRQPGGAKPVLNLIAFPSMAVGEDGSEAAISHRTQRLVYTRDLIDANIWRLEVTGPHGKIGLPMKLISSTPVDESAQFSPRREEDRFHFKSNGKL
jgi:hypothetical protein